MSSPLRRGATALAGLALAATTLTMAGAPAGAEPSARAAEAAAAVTDVSAASLTWGISGYAQDGIFGPWVIRDLSGDASLLEGSVSGGDQTTYAVAPVPATSMPPSTPQDTPNAVHFTGGTGTADPATGAVSLDWTGSYTVNAYPATFGAPDEVYSDPELTIADDGTGELTMDVTIGAGQTMLGAPTPAVELGRLTVMTFGAGSGTATGGDGFRYRPDYQGVEIEVPGDTAQTRSCSTAGGATGWWGAWPEELVNAVPDSVRPHFYSTGCAGKQDNKPPLPADVDLGLGARVSVEQTDFLPSGAYEVTVEGSGFDPAAATGTRPPLAGRPAGAYVVFGKFADTWRPSQGAASATRANTSQRWAVLAEDMATIGGPPAAVELTPEGTFSTTLTVDKAAIDAIATDPSLVNYGIYTYPGSGAVNPGYETYTPVTFSAASATLDLTAPRRSFGQAARVGVTVSSTTSQEPTGSVTLTRGGTTVGTTDLDGGAAVFALGRLDAGRYPLTATYSGDDALAGGSTSGTLRITKASTRTTVTLGRTPRPRKPGTAVVKVASPTADVGGVARIRVTEVGTRKPVLRRTLTLRGGKVSTRIDALPTGRYRLVAVHPGGANLEKSTGKVAFRVR